MEIWAQGFPSPGYCGGKNHFCTQPLPTKNHLNLCQSWLWPQTNSRRSKLQSVCFTLKEIPDGELCGLLIIKAAKRPCDIFKTHGIIMAGAFSGHCPLFRSIKVLSSVGKPIHLSARLTACLSLFILTQSWTLRSFFAIGKRKPPWAKRKSRV